MTNSHELASEIEAAAASLGISPSTIGARAGQGGRFYIRLKDGKRVWPETASKVREWIAQHLALARLSSQHASNTDESAPDTGAGQPIQMAVNKPGVNYDQP